MKTLLRTLLYLSLAVWLGGEIFFPVVAAVTFTTLQPDTHRAGAIVGALLRILHGMGLVAGMTALAVLALSAARGIYKPRAVLAPMGLLIAMIALTTGSQFGVTPAMEQERIAVGGSMNQAAPNNPSRLHFERLHKQSEQMEGGILLMGLVVVVLVAYAESSRP